MRFQAVVKNARITGSGVTITLSGGEGLNTEELRPIMDQLCIVDIGLPVMDGDVVVDPVTGEIDE